MPSPGYRVLKEASGFKDQQYVKTLVETRGQDSLGVERVYPPGTEAVIDKIERFTGAQGIAFTLVINPDDEEQSIVNVFDETDGAPGKFFEPSGYRQFIVKMSETVHYEMDIFVPDLISDENLDDYIRQRAENMFVNANDLQEFFSFVEDRQVDSYERIKGDA